MKLLAYSTLAAENDFTVWFRIVGFGSRPKGRRNPDVSVFLREAEAVVDIIRRIEDWAGSTSETG